MPSNLFSKSGRYIGPTFEELTIPATRATEPAPNPAGTGRMITRARRFFIEEWQHSIQPEVFIHKDWPNRIYSADDFNSLVRPFSDVDDTARIVKQDIVSKACVLKYDPSKKPGVYAGEGDGRTMNTFVPSNLKPEKGDVKPWLEFMELLVPNEHDRTELLRWCATLIARPDIRMMYGALLVSETQGVGKGTLGEKILAPLVGSTNVSYPSESEIVDSNFNPWLAHKRLAVVHEIYAGHSAKAYDKLKSIITDRYVAVNKKFQSSYDVENWLHIFACSNSTRAIQLTSDDRRWLVPGVTEEKQNPAYWVKFNAWLNDGGLNFIAWWAREWLKKNPPVKSGEPAPWSSAKQAVIEEGYSPGMDLVARFLDCAMEEAGDTPPIIIDADLVSLISQVIYRGSHSQYLERPQTIRKVAKARDWYAGPQVQLSPFGRRGAKAHLLSTNKAMANRLPGQLKLEGIQPLDVSAKAREWRLDQL